MDFAGVIPVSDGSICTELSAFTIQYGKRLCDIEGRYQLIREAEDTIVGLLHLLPSSEAKFAAFRKFLHRRSETQTYIEASDTDNGDNMTIETHASLEDTDAQVNDHTKLGKKALSTTPTKLILKSFRCDDLLSRETTAYGRMHKLQGIVVPEVYGGTYFDIPECDCEGEVEDLPALVLESIEGDDLHTYETDRQHLPELARAVEECCVRAAETGVTQWDPRLDGIFVTNSPKLTVKMIDFSHVMFDRPYTMAAARGSSDELMLQYAAYNDWEVPEDVMMWNW
jgi:hypothetical protein